MEAHIRSFLAGLGRTRGMPAFAAIVCTLLMFSLHGAAGGTAAAIGLGRRAPGTTTSAGSAITAGLAGGFAGGGLGLARSLVFFVVKGFVLSAFLVEVQLDAVVEVRLLKHFS